MLDVHSLLAFRQLLALAERGDVREGEAPAEPGLFSFWWLGGSLALPAAFANEKNAAERNLAFAPPRLMDRAAGMNQLTS